MEDRKSKIANPTFAAAFAVQAQELIVPAQVEIGVMQVELITDGAGAPYQYIRYTPYGEVRGRWSASGQWLNAPMAQDTREFTGYDSEILSGLQYAGARWYDPSLGLFLTHDPARQFASPYSYGGGDPLNWTDPTGAFFGELIAGIVAVAKLIASYAVPIAVTVGFGTAFGQTLANGGTFGQAFAAGAMGGLTAGIGAYGMGVVGAHVASFGNPLLSYALAAVAIAGSTYQTVESFRSGQYVAGAVGAVFVAFAVASLLASASGQAGAAGKQNGLRAGEEAQGFQLADAREGIVLNDASGPAGRDIDLLTRVTYAEAAGQHNVSGAMERVAWTVGNRVESPLFRDTYEGVVLQRNQFASVGGSCGWRLRTQPLSVGHR